MPEQIHGASLSVTEAGELAEMLTFCADWLAGPDHDLLAASLRRFIGTKATICPRSRPTWPGSRSCSVTTAPGSSPATGAERPRWDGTPARDG
jgi:hypothetical protein